MDYTFEQVKRYMHIYGNMCHQKETFCAGVRYHKNVEAIEKTIREAKEEIPEEFKDEGFNYVLGCLENIAQGIPGNVPRSEAA